MVNYKRVVCEMALLAALAAVATSAPTPDCAGHSHYDQRQNGTENYRLNIDGVVIAVAPVDSLLAAASEIDIGDFLGDLEDFNELQKPPKPSSTAKPEEPKPEEPKPQDLKPEEPKPSADKPAEAPLADVSMDSDTKPLKKDASTRKHEKAQKLKNRLAHFLLPLLRKTRHH